MLSARSPKSTSVFQENELSNNMENVRLGENQVIFVVRFDFCLLNYSQSHLHYGNFPGISARMLTVKVTHNFILFSSFKLNMAHTVWFMWNICIISALNVICFGTAVSAWNVKSVNVIVF